MQADFQDLFYQNLPDQPTKDQVDLVDRMQRFLADERTRSTFIIRGYAGTGKTTAIAALVKILPAFHWRSVLLAPTGRAAKVLGNFSKKTALTIHKKIYQTKRSPDGIMKFQLAENLHQDTIFIVDEASMISDGRGLSSATNFQQRSLLDDLVRYVFSGIRCKLILIGDIAQLPPVGCDISPALDPKFLKSEYQLNLKGVELKQVVRQVSDSGILYNATILREQVGVENPDIHFYLNEFVDIKSITGEELEDELNSCVSKYGSDDTIVICRSNKRANVFNQQVRLRIKGLDEEVATGDYLMVVKNNYFWLEEKSPMGFIANGDIAEVVRMGSIEELYDFRFLNVSLRMIDHPGQEPLDVKILLDAIMSDGPALSPEDNKRLVDTILEDYADEPNRKKKFEKLKKNPYYNALQVKFAYSVTCHKSQGGQWKAVFVDQGYLTEEMVNPEFVRWLYTAITRATEKLYLVNFHERFFLEK